LNNPIDSSSSTHQLPRRKDGQRVYGGQVVGQVIKHLIKSTVYFQALMAANATIDHQLFHPHSFHCQFISAADKDTPIIYDVIRVRDGRSFCSRIVQAKQNESTVFTAQISFQKPEPDSICHMAEMPNVPGPEECEDAEAFFKR
jgi:acyl-CoA thioesterase II